MILYAAARVRRCRSVQPAMVDDDRRSQVLTTSMTNEELGRLQEAENEMGFAREGARMPLAATESLIVQCYREARVIITHDIALLAGGILPPDTVDAIKRTIGQRTF